MSKRWLFLDFDSTLMETERHALPSLIARFNELYGDKISTPLTFDIFKENFYGQAREKLCDSLSQYFDIVVDFKTLYLNREWSVMRHYQTVDGGIAMAPNLIETLNGLRNAGFKLACVSNNPAQRALSAMRYADNGRGDELAALFGTNFFEAGDTQKPKPDVYLHAAQQVGADISQSFAVEDSATGATAAVAAGLTTFGYIGFSGEPEKLLGAGCRAVFDDWSQLPDLLRAA